MLHASKQLVTQLKAFTGLFRNFVVMIATLKRSQKTSKHQVNNFLSLRHFILHGGTLLILEPYIMITYIIMAAGVYFYYWNIQLGIENLLLRITDHIESYISAPLKSSISLISVELIFILSFSCIARSTWRGKHSL